VTQKLTTTVREKDRHNAELLALSLFYPVYHNRFDGVQQMNGQLLRTPGSGR